MAKHSKHRRGMFGDLPKLDTLKQGVNSGHDILMGAGIGLLGIAVGNWFTNKYLRVVKTGQTNSWAQKNPKLAQAVGPAGAIVAGVLAYSFFHADKAAKATGWLIGSVAAGLGLAGSRLVLDDGMIGWKMIGPPNVLSAGALAKIAAETGAYNPAITQFQEVRKDFGEVRYDGADEIEEMLT